jgi:N-acyl amino acid synthase of PEP-CTERM/exosortase system
MELYASHFEVVRATTPEQLKAALRLRYQVYCVENAFENPADNPDGMESDVYDSGSVHSLLLRRGTTDAVGTVRLILPLSRSGQEGTGLPIRDVCNEELVSTNNATLPWQATAEISRFAVSNKLRRRTDHQRTLGDSTEPDGIRRRLADSSLGLMQAAVAMCAECGITHVCAVMEPSLLRMLSRLGIHFVALGKQVIYHGRRQPCYSKVDELLARTWAERFDVWQILTRNGKLWPVNRLLAGAYQPRRYADGMIATA